VVLGILAVARWLRARLRGEGACDVAACLVIVAAVGCKPSYAETGAIVALGAAWRSGMWLAALAIGAACFLALDLPIFARNAMLYGNPSTPFLEGGRSAQDAVAIISKARLEQATPVSYLRPLIYHVAAVELDRALASVTDESR